MTAEQHQEAKPGQREKPGRQNWVARHFRGDLPLAASYWINSIVVGILIYVAGLAIATAVRRYEYAYSLTAGFFGYWIVIFILQIWLWVGIWRSSNRHISTNKRYFWATAAKIMVCISVLGTLARFVTYQYGLPAIVESFKYADTVNSLSNFTIAVKDGGKVLSYSGPIGLKSVAAVRETLEDNPDIEIAQLNSRGGLIDKAYQLLHLILVYHLTTYTDKQCYSACTIVFMGGRERYLKDGATLGFHRPQQIFFNQRASIYMIEGIIQSFYRLGYDRSFIDRAFRKTPNRNLWRPSYKELYAAHVITAVSTGLQFSRKEKPVWYNADEFERMLRQHRFYRILRKKDPSTYQNIVKVAEKAFQQGQSTSEVQQQVSGLIQPIVLARLPYSSRTAIFDFVRNKLRIMHVLRLKSPDLCAAFMYGDPGKKYDWTEIIPEKYQRAGISIDNAVLKTSDLHRRLPLQQDISHSLDVIVYEIEGRNPDVYRILPVLNIPRVRQSIGSKRVCNVTYDFYNAALHLPESDAESVFRYVFSNE